MGWSWFKKQKVGLVERDPFPEPGKRTKAPRGDAWQNAFTGFGTSRDKLTHGHYGYSPRLTDWEIDALFYSDDVAAKLVEKRPEETFRRGYKLSLAGDQTKAKDLFKQAQALGLDAKMQEAATWGRAFGGALLIIGVEQGLMKDPLNVKLARGVKYLNVIDRRFCAVNSFYMNPFLPNYGQPETYSIGGTEGGAIVHESRVVRFDGTQVDRLTRQKLGGWTYSVLQRPYNVMRDFATAFASAASLTADASQAVFKMKGLFEMIAAGHKERLQTRMQLVDMSRSAAKAVLLDADGEEFDRIATSFDGLPEMLGYMSMRLASSVDMPVTILMGRSPAGQNATGDSDFQHWYDTIASGQTKEYGPKLLRVYEILSAGKLPELELEWCPLKELTDIEKATIAKTNADTDHIYIQDGVVIPERVAVARFGSGNGKIEIDEEKTLASIDTEAQFTQLLEKARQSLGEKDLAALSIAQGVSPIIVSSLIQAGAQEDKTAATPPAAGPTDPNAPPKEEPDADPAANDEPKPGQPKGNGPATQ